MTLKITCLTLAAPLTGCAFMTAQPGFDRVQQEVAQRAGLEVRWDNGAEADQEARTAANALLKGELTAEKAMQFALLNNRELQAIYQDLRIVQADLVQAGLFKNPVFSGDLRWGLAGAGGASGASMGVAQDFISILAMPLRKARSEAAFEAEKLRVTGAVLDLAGEVRVAFYQAQADEQLREMRQSVLEATAASYELAKRVREAGNFRELDVSNERALYEQSKVDLASAEAQVLMSREHLNELMGAWGQQTQWRISGRLPEIPSADETGPEDLTRRALSQSLDLQTAAKEIEVAARSLGVTEATRFINEASIGIAAEREVADNRDVGRERRRAWYDLIGDTVTDAVRNERPVWPALPPHSAAQQRDGIWSLGPSISIPIPIFDQGQAVLTADHARFRQAVERYYALAVRLRSRLRAIQVGTDVARDKAVYYQQVIIPLRRRIVDETQLQYNAMQVSAFQLLQAKRDEINAGADYIEELRQFWIARSKLDLILNGRLPSGPREESMAPRSSSHADTRGGRDDDR